jgi:hypothetical protein
LTADIETQHHDVIHHQFYETPDYPDKAFPGTPSNQSDKLRWITISDLIGLMYFRLRRALGGCVSTPHTPTL